MKVLILMMVLSGCATVGTSEYRNGDQVVYVTHCNGGHGIGACYKVANSKCPLGWLSVNQATSILPQAIPQPNGSTVIINHVKRSVTYTCKGA